MSNNNQFSSEQVLNQEDYVKQLAQEYLRGYSHGVRDSLIPIYIDAYNKGFNDAEIKTKVLQEENNKLKEELLEFYRKNSLNKTN